MKGVKGMQLLLGYRELCKMMYQLQETRRTH